MNTDSSVVWRKLCFEIVTDQRHERVQWWRPVKLTLALFVLRCHNKDSRSQLQGRLSLKRPTFTLCSCFEAQTWHKAIEIWSSSVSHRTMRSSHHKTNMQKRGSASWALTSSPCCLVQETNHNLRKENRGEQILKYIYILVSWLTANKTIHIP